MNYSKMSKLYLILTSFLLIPVVFSSNKRKVTSLQKRPLVFQYEISHSRNTDQISLVFRDHQVELVTNTNSYQQGKKISLGRFQSPMDTELRELKTRIGLYYARLKGTISMLSLMADSRLKPAVEPHAPILRINEEEIQYDHPHFKSLVNIIYEIWGRKWTCIECATYQKEKDVIIRVHKKLKARIEEKTVSKQQESFQTIKQTIPTRLLNCVSKNKSKMECIDPQFGIFEI